MKMNNRYAGIALCMAVASAQGEILTGDGFYFGPGGAPIDFQFDGWGHNDVSYSDLYAEDYSVGPYSNSTLVVSNNTAGWRFHEGQAIGSANTQSQSVYWGSSEFMYEDGVRYDFVGEVGEVFYIGFSFTNATDAGNPVTNYGFAQVEKLTESSYDWVGWAYETRDNVDIVSFNLVPAPAGLAVLGIAGLGLARRRR